MRTAALTLIGLIALLHSYIAWFEIFAWESRGPKVFTSMDPALFAQTVDIAANQGMYNAFLAAGLFWSLLIKDANWQRNVAACFLIFVAVAGLFGAATVSTRILFVQTVPAVIGLFMVWQMRRQALAD